MRSIDYIRLEKVNSTNTWVKEHARAFDPTHLTCVTAWEQTAGRGRFQRQWISVPGESLLASLFFTLPQETKILSNLGQILSLSCATVLQTLGFAPQIKWPNDLLLSGKKVAGILCETVSLETRLGIALGIGLNVNVKTEVLRTIDPPATSLLEISGHTWKLEQILEPLLKQFLIDLEKLEQEGFAPFHPLYEKLLAFRGKTITVKNGHQTVTGICHSINAEGRLTLLLPDGKLLVLAAGEVEAGRQS